MDGRSLSEALDSRILGSVSQVPTVVGLEEFSH